MNRKEQYIKDLLKSAVLGFKEETENVFSLEKLFEVYSGSDRHQKGVFK